MAENPADRSVIEALRLHGDAGRTTGWRDGDPDYVAKYSLSDEHVPGLISLAIEWVDKPPEDVSVYGPVHAWRALGQLHAAEAVQPLLDVQDKLDEVGDDWYLEEFHDVFGLIGPPAVERLAAYLSDDSHGEFPRGKAAGGLREIARRYPEFRTKIVEILAGELARQRKEVANLNGMLVAHLVELQAVEAAETIELAFAENVIDPTVAGDWGAIRDELGVPG